MRQPAQETRMWGSITARFADADTGRIFYIRVLRNGGYSTLPGLGNNRVRTVLNPLSSIHL
ncbi:hypothetical protein N7462_004893 [Penicillium macrosclerotiorum]|uniref:uncharacterized protein n=1 Tax=Penicillium macrosclerotiorum TaxID=303699 RepID=UPI002546F55D|nr:uncharacterized protein N7462_004893 [Penicillium macrosclerotiorum]KAJ5690501.1 hypothetical protein N7462_004893 [Penicillium macrosclerotiorum]